MTESMIRAIARGTAAPLKSEIGGATLHVTLPEPADDAAVDVLWEIVAGEINVDERGRELTAPVRARPGLATDVVRALDRAGVAVDDVEVRKPSLDDVFFDPTGADRDRRADRDAPVPAPHRRLNETS